MMKMGNRIRIWSKVTGPMEAAITDENPETGNAVWKALPIRGNAIRWGDEIYFSVPVELGEEKGRTEVEVGSVAYWPPGRALCIFFGPTPVSRHGEPRAFSPVNVFAKIVGDSAPFRKVHNKEEITLERQQA